MMRLAEIVGVPILIGVFAVGVYHVLQWLQRRNTKDDDNET